MVAIVDTITEIMCALVQIAPEKFPERGKLFPSSSISSRWKLWEEELAGGGGDSIKGGKGKRVIING